MKYEIVALVNGELFMFSTFKKAEAEKQYQDWCDRFGKENVSVEVS